jgi:ketosteroid isomerase-like protein
MSQENVEIVRRSFDAIGQGDIEALLELYDSDVEFSCR